MMMSRSLLVLRDVAVRWVFPVVALFAAIVGLAGSPASARVFVGVGIPFYGPGFYPPPIYYPPPPVYYTPPPPVIYAQPQPPVIYAQPRAYSQGSYGAPSGSGQACYAGAYVCPMDRPTAGGGSCYCLGNGGQRIWGKTN